MTMWDPVLRSTRQGGSQRRRSSTGPVIRHVPRHVPRHGQLATRSRVSRLVLVVAVGAVCFAVGQSLSLVSAVADRTGLDEIGFGDVDSILRSLGAGDDDAGQSVPISAADRAPVAAASSNTATKHASAALELQPLARTQPARLLINSIDVDATIAPVGLDDDGQFAVPTANEVGWYRFGSTPGDPGSAVLAAHVDYAGVAGVFFDLRSVQAGDLITIANDDGTEVHFQVVGVQQYQKSEIPLEDLFDDTGTPRLVLVTCGGAFDRSVRSYRDNLVVIATPIDRAPDLPLA